MDNQKQFHIDVSNEKKRFFQVLIMTILWGLFAHGFIMTNKISFHDDIYSAYYLGGTYGMGRFVLGVINKTFSILGGNYSLPWFNGVCTLILIGIAAYLLITMFQIEKTTSRFVLTGIMTTIPVITCLFGYMFTSFPYMIGMLLSVIAVDCWSKAFENANTDKRKNIIFMAAGVICLCLATGVYQPYFAFGLCILGMKIYVDLLENRITEPKAFLTRSVSTVIGCVISLVCYLLFNQFFLKLVHKTMYEYAGVQNMGVVSIKQYGLRILRAYKEFFLPTENANYSVYPMLMRYFYLLFMIHFMILLGIQIVRTMKSNRIKAFEMLLISLLFPMLINFIFVLADPEQIYAMNLYGQVLLFLLYIWLLEKTVTIQKVKTASLVALLFVNLWYVRYDNICYLKANMLQQRAISYFNTLITRIQSVEGYDDELPVAFINPNEKEDHNLAVTEQFEWIKLMPYADQTIINNYAWLDFMREWCGYEPKKIYPSDYVGEFEGVRDMPHYPDEGSIEVKYDMVIVHF